jgi:aminoglycoside phosphotransferase (APT) family kinase protein
VPLSDAAHRAALEGAVVAFDVDASSVDLITPWNAAKGGRALYRATRADSTSVKLRVLQSPEAAHELRAIRGSVPSAFAPVLAVHGPVLLETWVDGVAVVELGPSPERCGEAGALLATLHRSTAGDRMPTEPWMELARADLAALHMAGHLDDEAAERLGERLEAGDPGSCTACVIHRDFCGVNMVIDAHGGLCVIDNEWFVAGPAGFDLGRTLNRWWMTDAERSAFLDAYAAGGTPEDADHWGLVADLFGARVETVMNPEPGTPILDQLLARIGPSPA